MLTVGSLFSGIGGFDLGLERAGYEIKWQVENNDYCRRVLQKHWPSVPCHYDTTTIDWHWIPRVDLVCGGFPCQPFSCAGKQRGKDDDRYLWPEVVRCLDALRPAWFLGENVPGIINMALDQVCADLEGLGYQVWSVCLPACAVDAPHIRQRLWIVAHTVSTDGRGQRGLPEFATDEERRTVATWTTSLQSRHGSACAKDAESSGEDVADADHGRLSQSESQPSQEGANRTSIGTRPSSESWWATEPNVGRVAHGIPRRVDRLRGLGNAVVPQVAEALGRMILEVHQQETAAIQKAGLT